jgi:uncharacterized protein YbjT (DUF2867 family)
VIVVTGATGNIGRPLIDLLRKDGAPVCGVTRTPQASTAVSSRVEFVAGDPSRPPTMASALHGATGLFINPMATQGAVDELLTLAKDSGVTRVVALSATNLDDDPAEQPSRLRGVNHRAVEDALSRSGIEWVALRISTLAVNSIPLWAAQIRAGDAIFGTHAASASSPIHERDVAAVAVRAFRSNELVGKRPVLTGPQSLTQSQMVGVLGEALGRPLRYVEISPQEAKRAMLERGFAFPEELIDRLHALLAKGVKVPALISGEVESILGRPALTYAQWAIEHINVFTASKS